MRTIVSHLALLLENEEQEITTFITQRLMGVSFRKPTRPSLPLRKAPPLISVFSPQGRRGKNALRCSEPLRSKVGGPSKVFAILCGLGPPGCKWKHLLLLNFGGVSEKSGVFRNIDVYKGGGVCDA